MSDTYTWPATIAGHSERQELPHENCEAVAERMDRLYDNAPLEAHERAALIFLYSAKFVNEAQKLWHHRAKKVDLMSGVACNDPWSDIMPDITQYPIERVASRIRKIESYVRYLELRYFENGPLSAHPVTAVPIAPTQCDDIVFCAKSGRSIQPGQSPMQTAPMRRYDLSIPGSTFDDSALDADPLNIRCSTTFADIDEWAKQETLSHEPEPL